MFSKIAIVVLAAMATLSVAAPSRREIEDSCNAGEVQCCNSVQSSKSDSVTKMATLLGLDLGDVTTMVGLNCSPLSVIGLGSGSSCSSQPVCCENNTFNGLVAIGCSPVNINL